MTLSALVKKLRFQEEEKALLLNAPDGFQKAMKEKGIRPVMRVSVDSTCSALRFRPAEAVGT